MKTYCGWARKPGRAWVCLAVAAHPLMAGQLLRGAVVRCYGVNPDHFRGSLVVLPERVSPVPDEQARRRARRQG